MVEPSNDFDEFILNKEHDDRKAWLEANGLEEPLGCKNPLDILIELEVELEVTIEIHYPTKSLENYNATETE